MKYVARELWYGASARAPRGGQGDKIDKGLNRKTNQLTLVRWDAARPATVDNLVLLTFDEADAHKAIPSLADLEAREPQFYAFVEGVLSKARRDHNFGLAGFSKPL
mmetsp:Transcript_24269/g.76364  ORF Transcript_24269/g.76364 Transcript_24269/m.76364 type:complete len:106 (+) Transcript_24269:1115-1432(+)